MPRLWDQSVQTHRRTVHDAVLDAAARLVDRRGLASVTMAGIATEAGIGRATLYKYFSDVDAVLLAWHRRHIADHLEQLAAVRDRADGPAQRLHAVVQAYAGLRRHQPRGQIATNLHRGNHVDDAAHQLRAMLADVIADAATAGAARNDVPALELAVFCESALAAATELDTADGVERLVRVALAGLGARA